MIILTIVYLLFIIPFSRQLNNGLGRTPQMGKREKKSFEEKTHVNFSLLKDGIVGIILLVVSTKLWSDKRQIPL
jgi:hypothetical protein